MIPDSEPESEPAAAGAGCSAEVFLRLAPCSPQPQQEGRGRKGAGRRAVLRAVLHAYKGDGAGMPVVCAAALLPYTVLILYCIIDAASSLLNQGAGWMRL